MKNPFSKNSPVAKFQDLLAKFEAGLDQLQKRRVVVGDLLEQGREKRRAFIRDNPGIEVPAELRHAIGAAEGDARATAEEIAEYEAQISELRDGLVHERQRGAREEAAKADEALADFVDREFGPELAKAIAIVSKAVTAFSTKIPEGIAIVEAREWSRDPHHPRRFADSFSREEILGAIIAEAIFEAAPAVFEHLSSIHGRQQVLRRMFDLNEPIPTTRSDGTPPPVVRNAHRTLLSDRLRARAAATRNGEQTVVDRTAEAPAAMPDTKAPTDEVQIVAIRDSAFVESASGKRKLCGRRWVHNVPALAADAALDAGLALRTDTPEGRDAFEAEKEYRRTSMTVPSAGLLLEDCEDLKDPCNFFDDPDNLEADE